MNFQTGENIEWTEGKGGMFQCICADEGTAVFAPIVVKNDVKSVKYKNMFAVANAQEMNDVIMKSYKKVI